MLKFYLSTTWLHTLSDDNLCWNCKTQNSETNLINGKHWIWGKIKQTFKQILLGPTICLQQRKKLNIFISLYPFKTHTLTTYWDNSIIFKHNIFLIWFTDGLYLCTLPDMMNTSLHLHDDHTVTVISKCVIRNQADLVAFLNFVLGKEERISG